MGNLNRFMLKSNVEPEDERGHCGSMAEDRLKIQPASRDDYDIVFDLFFEVQVIHAAAHPKFFRPPKKDEHFHSFLERVFDDPAQHLLLARVDQVPVGYIQYFLGKRPEDLFQPERKFAYIHQLVISEAYRRSGYATALIGHVRALAREQGVERVGIDFWSFNKSARACFERQGFVVKQ